MKENQTSYVASLLEMALGISQGPEAYAFQVLISALTLVLRGWHQGDFSPFGVKVRLPWSRSLSLCKTSGACVLIYKNEKHKLSQKMHPIGFSPW